MCLRPYNFQDRKVCFLPCTDCYCAACIEKGFETAGKLHCKACGSVNWKTDGYAIDIDVMNSLVKHRYELPDPQFTQEYERKLNIQQEPPKYSIDFSNLSQETEEQLFPYLAEERSRGLYN